jgi:adenylylsulfate kinase
MLILQLTGLSGAGKSTLAEALKRCLEERGFPSEVIDGDRYRQSISKDLGFSAADRKENIRRLAAVANTFRQQGIIAIMAAINPFEETRREVAQTFGAKTIWLRCDLAILVKRDPKGLYWKALLPDSDPQKIRNLSGVNDPYETPAAPDLVIDTGITDLETSKQTLLAFVLTTMEAASR